MALLLPFCVQTLLKKIIAWDFNTFLDAFRILDEDILVEAMLNGIRF
jgi:hypothetical protein